MLDIAVSVSQIPDHRNNFKIIIFVDQAGLYQPCRDINHLIALGVQGFSLIGQVLVIGQKGVRGIDKKSGILVEVYIGLKLKSASGGFPDILLITQINPGIIDRCQQMVVFGIKDGRRYVKPVFMKPAPSS